MHNSVPAGGCGPPAAMDPDCAGLCAAFSALLCFVQKTFKLRTIGHSNLFCSGDGLTKSGKAEVLLVRPSKRMDLSLY